MKQKIQKVIIIFLILFIATVVGSLFYFRWAISSSASNSDSRKIFEISQGDGKLVIAKNLSDKGIIQSEYIFLIASKIKEKSLLPGIYELSPKMSVIEILDAISSGKTKVTKITIPEGYRVEQIGQVLENKEVAKSDQFVEKASQYEGTLFPDTYYFTKETTVDNIINSMRSDFQERTKYLQVSKENLIIASIVEREAIKDEERPLIAGVYKNRIKKNMKLEADPTVQYAKDNNDLKAKTSEEKKNYKFWQVITSKDYLTVQSEYNTYIIAGLPPTPICNPGLASIKATINYQNHDYLYFLQKDGNIYPAENAAGHEKNKANVLGVKK